MEPLTAIDPNPPAAKPAPPQSQKPTFRDTAREVVETVVFVVVLVTLLRTFVAEAFVIPTGSMAETLFGHQKWVHCPQCDHDYPVNCSGEVDPPDERVEFVDSACCPNCRFVDVWRDGDRAYKSSPLPSSGDRVLVSKFLFDSDRLGKPDRFNVLVFKYPEQPQKNQTALNYIKRLIGLPGETVAIFDGDVYVLDKLTYSPERYPRPEKSVDAWRDDYMYENAPHAIEAFRRGEFQILRKPLNVLLEEKRLVYDNDHPPRDLTGKLPPRWQAAGAGWQADDRDAPKRFTFNGHGTADTWLRYQHVVLQRDGLHGPVLTSPPPPPEFITNFLGYNTANYYRGGRPDENKHWVGDLILEATVTTEAASGEVWLELSKGQDRFQARFRLSDGVCTLVRLTNGEEQILGTATTAMTKPGAYVLRFANVDERLTVWVNGLLPFKEGVTYPAAKVTGPDEVNDKQPASVGVHGDAKLTVSGLRLWRDTYYTGTVSRRPRNHSESSVVTRYVQPGHYLMMGDNSTQSSDGRQWGLVPDRLLLGRATVIFFPLTRVGPIR